MRAIEIFVDRRTIEVYLNEGEAAGTKVFYSEKKDGHFIAVFDHPELVSELEVYQMESIW